MAYLIALSLGSNILFTESKDLARSSKGELRRERRRSPISAFSIQIISERGTRDTYFWPFKGENLIKVHCNCKIIVNPVIGPPRSGWDLLNHVRPFVRPVEI